MKKQPTYILKYTIHNDIPFPFGTLVRIINEEHKNFIVHSGKLKGKKGFVADGLNGLLLENTTENRNILSTQNKLRKKLQADLVKVHKVWKMLPTVKIKKA